MPKDIPTCPRKPESGRGPAHVYEMELQTPLFGGGAEVRVNDPAYPIRVSAIRGQLHFWWRATQGRRFANPAALWQREEEIFGSVRLPSPLRVSVELDSTTPITFAPATEFNRFGPDGYALFALQQGDRVIREGLRFRVTTTWLAPDGLNRQRKALNEQLAKAKQPLLPKEVPDIADDVRDAVWAWVNFGGLGGRTRRGCGALKCNELAPQPVADIPTWFHDAQQRFGTLATAPLWSQLGPDLYYSPRADNAINSWLQVIDVFKTFRQGENVGRNPGRVRNRPGRSRFPEPETIREALRRRGREHPRQPEILADAFPRAEFGLPIVFQFQGREVDQTVLYPRVGKESPERMASPLVLKPLCLQDGSAVPAIIPLVVPWFSEVDLTLGGRSNVRRVFPRSATRRPDLATYPNSPLAGSAAGSAIEAFLGFAQNANNDFRRA
jgi:CRISPR-associated protein Cmr1